MPRSRDLTMSGVDSPMGRRYGRPDRFAMTLEVRLLGSVEALIDGHSLSLGGSKQRSVVAMLALRANTTLSGDELIDGLWGDDPPASAAKNLQLYIWRLRRALAEGRTGAEILTRGRGYELRLPARAVDALRFEELPPPSAPTGRASSRSPPADPASASTLLRRPGDAMRARSRAAASPPRNGRRSCRSRTTSPPARPADHRETAGDDRSRRSAVRV
jgi:DNA-binding winged helix-turn-helix (wHTH) protein